MRLATMQSSFSRKVSDQSLNSVDWDSKLQKSS